MSSAPKVPWTLPPAVEALADEGDLVLRFESGEESLTLHSQLLRMASAPLAGMLDALPARGEKGELLVADSRDAWVAVLPLLYPFYLDPEQQLNWEQVLCMLEVVHKYDMERIDSMCCTFLEDPSNAFSHSHTHPGYVLRWMDIAERLHMVSVLQRCIQSVTSVQCPYCGKMVPQHTYCCGRVVQVPQVKQRPVLGDRESLSKLSKETLLELLTGLQ